MVKVVRVHALGGPDVLNIDELDRSEPGPNEVRIRTAAIGLNRVEVMYRRGEFGMPRLPARIGYEASGTVEALGSTVTGVAVGDRVATIPGLSMEEYGTYAESFLYPADMLVSLPNDQSFDDSAATWMAFLTAYAIAEGGEVRPGDFVVLSAASSSVGLAAIQVVKAEGGISVAVTRTAAKMNELKRHGADHVIVSDDEDVPKRIMKITQKRGAKIAFDAVAGSSIAELATAMAPGGTIIVYGTLNSAQAEMPLHMLMMNGLAIRGFSANQVTLDPERCQRAVAYIKKRLSIGAFKPVIDKRFSISEIAGAHRYLESNAQVGKIVVMIP